jgi:tetratricopeptide (TPR) repeat protein
MQIKVFLCIIGVIVASVLIDKDVWFNENCNKILQKGIYTVSKNVQPESERNAPSVFAGGLIGYRYLSADLLWIDTVQYIGNNKNSQEGFKKFYYYIKQITSIDPNFTYAYIFGSSILMWQLYKTDEAMEVIRSGIENNPEYWQLNIYLAAFTYFKSNEFKKMVVYLEHALAMENHPAMLERILGNIYEKIEENEKARQLWWWMWYNTKDIENKKYAGKRLKEKGYWYQ